MIEAIKTGISKALIVFTIFLIPVYGIKWGITHRDFPWLHYFKKAEAAHFSLESPVWSNTFDVTIPWQEKAAIVVCTFFAAYIFFQLRFHISSDKKHSTAEKKLWERPDELFKWGSYLFLFLYIAACALCERTNLGTVNIEFNYTSLYRDFGVTALIVSMLFLSRFLVKQVSFNGMLMRDDFSRAYKYLVGALAALAICFAAWLPFFALPGALIMIRFALERIKEIDYLRGSSPDTDYANCDEGD